MKYYGADSPHFATDGKNVIYSGETNNYPAPSFPLLLEVDADGTKPPHTLGPEPNAKGTGKTDRIRMGAWASDPNISQDGKTIVFLSDRAKNFAFAYDLYVMKAGRLGRQAARHHSNRQIQSEAGFLTRRQVHPVPHGHGRQWFRTSDLQPLASRYRRQERPTDRR
jgi:WD40-like Beta Propeller Repeat